MTSIGEDVEKLAFVHYWRECKMAQLLWKPVSRSSKSDYRVSVWAAIPVPVLTQRNWRQGSRKPRDTHAHSSTFHKRCECPNVHPEWVDKHEACIQWNSVQSYILENGMRLISHSQKQQNDTICGTKYNRNIQPGQKESWVVQRNTMPLNEKAQGC